jgi:hypothetical protein
MAYIYDLADTWNASGTTFTAIKMNVTDTASAAASLLMDLQVGGTSKFSVTKAGTTTFSGNLQISNNGVYIEGTTTGTVRVPGVGGYYGWTTNSASTSASTIDLFLLRDAANTLAQRNGVNAQAFNLYNTYTDASNYERGFMRFVSNVLQIGSEKLGTGTARALAFQTDGTTRLTLGATDGIATFTGPIFLSGSTRKIYASDSNAMDFGGVTFTFFRINNATGVSTFHADYPVTFGSSGVNTPDTGVSRAAAGVLRINNASTGGGAMQLTEMTAPAAPATDNVRIYAEDNGLGKTRLMVLFATGVAQQLALEL